MKIRITLPMKWMLAGLLAFGGVHAVVAKTQESGFDFNTPGASGWFEGWSRGNLKQISHETENGNGFLRVTLPEATSSYIQQVFPVPEEAVYLTISARMRARNLQRGPESWMGGLVHYLWFDKDGKQLGGWPKLLTLEDTDWRPFEETSAIPEGAATLKIQLGLLSAAGTVDFDDLRLVWRKELPSFDAELPDGLQPGWGEEAVEAVTATRGRICLNGIWKFQPVQAASDSVPETGWGWMQVPGSWGQGSWYIHVPGLLARGKGPGWTAFKPSEQTYAWYDREILVPAEWENRAIELSIHHVCTDARVFVDGRYAGSVAWPRGVVDLTGVLTPGKPARLSIQVIATADEKEILQFMETATAQVSKRAATVDFRGLTGEVFLESRPRGARIGDVFVQTSVEHGEIKMDVEFLDFEATDVILQARMLNENGAVEKTFSSVVTLSGQASERVDVRHAWPDPRLWDVGQPNLYTLHLEVRSPDEKTNRDVYAQRFGFREFKIEGRNFILNGRPLRLRPICFDDRIAGGTPELMDRLMKTYMEQGYNFAELWPYNHDERGRLQYRELIMERADEIGFPLAGVALSMNSYIIDPNFKLSWNEPGVRDVWEQRMQVEMRRTRNHPSVLMWSTSVNFFGSRVDQDPRFIGRKNMETDEGWQRRAAAGREGIARIKAFDPTRPVFTHQGSDVGDVHTVNMYLNLIPLQEREEWLSQWAQDGDLPFLPIEFGTPLETTMLRGRNGFPKAMRSEPWMTEFCAIYFGVDAYRMEAPAYRRVILSNRSKSAPSVLEKPEPPGGQRWDYWAIVPELAEAEAFQKLLHLFNTHTWRTWRTWGITGGMIPWSVGHGWTRPVESRRDRTFRVEFQPFQPGRRGVWRATEAAAYVTPYAEPAVKTLPSGHALMAHNGPTLAWIAGAPEFVAKDHHFRSGQKVDKQIVLINDQRSAQPFQFHWSVHANGVDLASGEQSGLIGIATNLFFPIQFACPTERTGRVAGEIRLTARIGDRTHEDVFAFRVYPDSVPEIPEKDRRVSVLDPVGKTTEWLRFLGYEPEPWSEGTPVSFLIVGREALTTSTLPASLEALIRGGGRVLVMSQPPDRLRDPFGFRVAEHLSRRVFPVHPDHPVTAGLDIEDLRDWNGTSTLVEARPQYRPGEFRAAPSTIPYAGWRWGNRGSISSAPIEKPHLSGWRPILESEFDLAYSPLMELDLGLGRILLCTLDLEDQAGADPVAEILSRRVLDYARTGPLAPRVAKTVYRGGPAGRRLLEQLGLLFEPSNDLPEKADSALLVIGPDAPAEDAKLRDWIRAGGRVLFLAHPRETGPIGMTAAANGEFSGSLNPPDWEETRGITASDLRRRTDGEAWLIAGGEGIEIGADGLLGRLRIGSGVALFCQLDPEALNADNEVYLRFTRWRQTRALVQLLANLGGELTADAQVFRADERRITEIPLAGLWPARLVHAIPGDSLKAPDPGASEEALGLLRDAGDVSGWPRVRVPGMWETMGGEWTDVNGEAVYVLDIEVPAGFIGQDLILDLGPVDDFDLTSFNGVTVGGSPDRVTSQWNVPRSYPIPARLVKPGVNRIAVRVWDEFGGGGFGGMTEAARLRLAKPPVVPSFYHPDYRDDFGYGDNPYRYYRW